MNQNTSDSEDDTDEFFEEFTRLDCHILHPMNPPEATLAPTTFTSSSLSCDPLIPRSFNLTTSREEIGDSEVGPSRRSGVPYPLASAPKEGQARRRPKRTRKGSITLQDPTGRIARDGRQLTSEVPFTTSPLQWECSRCTLVNASTVTKCAACGLARNSCVSSSGDGEGDVSGRGSGAACPHCTFFNTSPTAIESGKCEICELPLSSFHGKRFRVEALASHAENLSSTTPSEWGSTVGHAASSLSGVQRSSPPPNEFTIEESDDDASISSFSSASLDDSVSEEEEEDVPAEEGVASENAEDDSEKMVGFLQQLNTFYASTDLPCAPTPESMVSFGHLKAFQLQGLYWLLTREKKQVPGMPERSPTSFPPTSFLPSSEVSSSTLESYTEGKGVAGRTKETKRKESLLIDTEEDSNVAEVPTTSGLDKVRGGIFADFMGLGKTRTLLSLCESTRDPRRRASHVSGSEVLSSATLVVAPTSLVGQWIAEIRECVRPVPRVLHYHGNKRKKLSMFQIAEDYDYVFVGYQTLRSEAFPPRSREMRSRPTSDSALPTSTVPSASLSSSSGASTNGTNAGRMIGNASRNRPPVSHLFMIRWSRVILDEAHYIRNARSKMCRSCFLLTSDTRWAVTATPVQNSINDVFPLLQFLQVPLFGDVKWWNREIIGYLRQSFQHPRPTTALRLLFSSLALRRVPSTTINGIPILNLPPISVVSVRVQLSPAEREFYSSVHLQSTSKMQSLADAANRTSSSRRGQSSQQKLFQTAFEMLIRCRQTCLHPYIVVAALRRIRLALSCDGAGSHKESIPRDGVPSPHEEGNATLNQLPNNNVSDDEKREKGQEKEVMEFINKKLLRMLKRTARHRQLSRDEGNQANDGTVMNLISSDFVQELIQSLREHTLQNQECLICLEEMNAPGILPCGHTFCYDCICHALEVTPRCPTCKHPTVVNHVLLVPDAMLQDPIRRTGPFSSHRLTAFDETEVVRLSLTHDISQYTSWPISFSSKTRELLRHLERIPHGEKSIIFSSFTTYLFYLKHYLDTNTNFRSALLFGSMSLPQKNKVLQRFRAPVSTEENSEEDHLGLPTILLATITACGVGLNLACANHGFIMDPVYNPGVEIQAIHRIHRMGQEKPVKVIKFLGDETVELKLEELCKQKASMHNCCFGEDALSGTVSLSSSSRSYRLTAEELRMLFS